MGTSVISTPKSDNDLIRRLFATEERLSEDEANRAYSDSRLNMAREADPRLYQDWVAKSRLAAGS